jgi:hypothetical protein
MYECSGLTKSANILSMPIGFSKLTKIPATNLIKKKIVAIEING